MSTHIYIYINPYGDAPGFSRKVLTFGNKPLPPIRGHQLDFVGFGRRFVGWALALLGEREGSKMDKRVKQRGVFLK